jgi:hypothetical protein
VHILIGECVRGWIIQFQASDDSAVMNTYALLKSYILAGVKRDDPRLKAAYAWLKEHYTLDVNPGFDVSSEPKTGLIWETFALLNTLKNSATTSRRFAPPNGKYFRMRKSIVASAGVFREFLAKAIGRADNGKAWL